MEQNLIEQTTDVRYASWIKMMVDLIKPKNLYLVGGRGVAKSTEILADRIIDVVYDMPRANFAFISDTYANLLTNIIPQIIVGWQRKDFIEGFHYVLDKEPPSHWPKPLTPCPSHKHTITIFNGGKIYLKSLDRPSINAGISIAHMFGDEAKYLKRQKLNKALPTLRGDAILLQRSTFFMGQSFLTDMPNTAHGEDDWILSMAEKMDKDIIQKILQCALVVNEIKIQIHQASLSKDNSVSLLQKELALCQARLNKLRYESSFFYVVSSLANVDILTLNYLQNQLESMDIEEFKCSILSIKTALNQGERFYFNQGENNFYRDGYDYCFYDKFSLNESIKASSQALRYVVSYKPLELGFDPGNMMSLVVAQEHGDCLRFLKSIYTLVPEFINELAVKFLDYFASHQNKIAFLHADRAANQYNKSKEDFANKLKRAIEWQDNKPTGWNVTLMSVGAKNVEHWQEYQLANIMLEGKNKSLPRLLIDAYECKELKSSMEIAPMEKVKGRIQKVKKSEKLALQRLPLESTNMSDAFKAIICQPKYIKALKGLSTSVGDVKSY
ncbi:MAG: hypothetical protein WCO63_16135 [Bacteroidota bacterium]